MESKILDFEINEKNLKIICIVSCGIIILFCLAIYLEFGAFINYKIPEAIQMDAGAQIEFTVDKVIASRRYIEVEGWAYKKGQNVGFFQSKFILKSEEENKYYAMRTGMTYVDELFSVDGMYDCRRAGMHGKSIALLLKRGMYRVYIEYKNDGENILVDTGYVFKF